MEYLSSKIKRNKEYTTLSGRKLLAIIFAIMTLFIITAPTNSHAALVKCTSDPNGMTTDDFKIVNVSIASDIILKIKAKLIGLNQLIYEGIQTNAEFITAMNGVLTLYIMIYAAMFMTGMIQVRMYDALIRLMKVGIIVVLITPNTWSIFNGYVVQGFNSFTDETIRFILGKPALDPTITEVVSGLPTMQELDSAISKVVSSRMFVNFLALALVKDYGLFFAALLLISIISFLKSLMMAMWVYVMSLVMKTLLFGLAPLFMPTILFQRTRHIFDSWVAQLINASLQPVLLFVFFVFFVKMMEGAADSIMATEVCFTRYPEGWRGTPFEVSFWKHMEFKNGLWQPDTSAWSTSKPFPVDIVAILSFLTLAEIANRFNSVVIQISSQISQASTNLSNFESGPLAGLYHSASQKFGATQTKLK